MKDASDFISDSRNNAANTSNETNGITDTQLEDVIRRHASLEAGAPVPADYALNADLLVKFKVRLLTQVIL